MNTEELLATSLKNTRSVLEELKNYLEKSTSFTRTEKGILGGRIDRLSQEIDNYVELKNRIGATTGKFSYIEK